MWTVIYLEGTTFATARRTISEVPVSQSPMSLWDTEIGLRLAHGNWFSVVCIPCG